MNIIESIEYYQNDIKRSTEKVELYALFGVIFEGVKFPKGVNTWAARLEGDSTLWIEFSPGHQDDSDKNLQPLIHAICQKHSVEFRKQKNYNGSALEYSANFTYSQFEVNVRVSGIVPKSCRIEETVEYLSDEEIEQARQDALNNVQTTRTIRKIVCTDDES